MKQKLIFLLLAIIAFPIGYYFISDNISKEQEETAEFIPADDWFTSQRAFPFDEIPNEEYLKAQNYVNEKMPADARSKAVNWTLAGPMNIEGRITCIAADPVNPQLVYIGTANGGMWKTTDNCQSWTSIFDHQNTSSIGAITIDPANSNILYCGTGEANSLRSYYPGTGVYKSTDAGATWTFKGLDSSFTIGRISISGSGIIYAAAEGYTRRSNPQRGIYRSSNGGNSWTKSLYLSDSVAAIDVIVDPSIPNKVFAAMWERSRREDRVKYGGPNSGLYMSTNDGASWTQVSGGFPVNDATLGRISIDIAKSNSQIIFALTALTNGNNRGLYKSTNGGVNWSLINSSVGASSNYAWFNREVKINPSNANDLICAGLNMERSTDGGISFTTISAISHVDEHAIAYSPSNPGSIIFGNDGGIDHTTNNGASWIESTTLPITQFYAGDIDYNNPSTIAGGAQDNGTIKTTSSVSTWSSIYGGDGFVCKIDPTNPLKIYASSQNGGFGRSTDGGNSFSSGTSGLDLTYSNWLTPYELDKVNPNIIYAGTYKIFRSTNSMVSWTAISPDLANGHVQNLGTVTTLDVSKSNPNVIYAGTDDANVWVTTNGGTAWAKINAGLPYRWVTRVTIHPDSANVCYVTLSGYKVDSLGAHIYRTTNYGTSWSSIKGNLPDMPINDVIIDPDHTSTLVIGTDAGVLYTTNLGNTWQVMGSGLPSNVPVHDLTLHNPTKTIVAWTHGRSAFRFPFSTISDINEPVEIVQDFKLFQNYPNPFNPTTNISYNLVKSSIVKLMMYDISGRLMKVLDEGFKESGLHNIHVDGNNLSSGIYFYRLEAGNRMETKKMILVK